MAALVEPSDIQDAEIVNNSVVENGQKAGIIRFVYKAEDGSTLVSSEWMQEKDKRRALLPWCAAVRSALVNQNEEARAAERAAVLAARAAETPRIVETTGQPIQPSLPVPSAAGPITGQSPTEYVTEMVRLWRLRRSEAIEEMQVVKERLAEATQALAQWRTVAKSLGMDLEEDSI